MGDDYGRNAGLEGAFISDDGQISLWGAIHNSWKPNISGNNRFYNTGFAFNNPNWEVVVANGSVLENYYADLGFIARIENYDAERDTSIRVGFIENVANVTYRIRPRKGIVFRHSITSENQYFFNTDWSFNEGLHRLAYNAAFRSTAELNVSVSNQTVELLYPFSFISEGEPLPVDRYDYRFLNVSFSSDERKAVSFRLQGQTGGFYNGTLNQYTGNINFRLQPWVNLNFGYEWNRLEFPDPYGEETITALLSTLEIGFNQNLFWTTLFQYLDQSEYMGINSRLMWRFAPMSDLFLVYVDNYDVFNNMGMRATRSNNRAVILKINYWY